MAAVWPPARWSFQHHTTLEIGAGCARGIGAATARFGTRALLVTGAHAFAAAPWSPAIIASFAQAGVACERVSVAHEPDTASVDAASAHARTTGCDVVVAIGGGSALDTAKAAAAVATSGGSSLDYLEGLPDGVGGQPLREAPLPIICVPTTAGTGSEVTRNAVIQAERFRVKRSLRADALYPRLAFIDAELIVTSPPRIAAACAFDALTHLVESWCSRKASPFTDALVVDGVARACSALVALMEGRWNTVIAGEAALAATLGGICLANAGLGAAHGLVAPLGGLFPAVAHGAALACLLPATLRINGLAAARGGDLATSGRLTAIAHLLLAQASPPADAGDPLECATTMLIGWRRTLGLSGLAASGIGEADLPAIARMPSGSLQTNPVALDDADLIAILSAGLAD